MEYQMTQLIANKRLDYAGKSLAAGERFEATAGDARTLTVTGLATLAEPEAQPARRRYKRRDMQAEA
jgi:hypothetical protein